MPLELGSPPESRKFAGIYGFLFQWITLNALGLCVVISLRLHYLSLYRGAQRVAKGREGGVLNYFC